MMDFLHLSFPKQVGRDPLLKQPPPFFSVVPAEEVPVGLVNTSGIRQKLYDIRVPVGSANVGGVVFLS